MDEKNKDSDKILVSDGRDFFVETADMLKSTGEGFKEFDRVARLPYAWISFLALGAFALFIGLTIYSAQ